MKQQYKEPNNLYKYRSLEGTSFKNTLDILINRHIYLPTIEKLNDPCEGLFKFKK
jgi:hypothetical protein